MSAGTIEAIPPPVVDRAIDIARRAEALIAQNRSREALEICAGPLAAALARGPGDRDAFAAAARLLRHLRQFDRLLAVATAWVTGHPDDGPAYGLLGDARLGAGSGEASVSPYRHAIALGGASAAVLERLCRGRLPTAEGARARWAAAGALILAPGDARPQRTLANAAFRAGDDRACLTAVRRARQAAGLAPSRLAVVRRLSLPRIAAERGWDCRTAAGTQRIEVATGSPRFGTVAWALPRSVIVSATDVGVLPNGALLAGDGWCVDGVLPYSPSAMNGLLDMPGARRPGDDSLPIELPAAEARFDEPAVLIGGDGNFGHWMSHWLSKLHVLDAAAEPRGELPVLVAHDTPAAVLDLLELLGVARPRIRLLATDAITRVRHAIVPSLSHQFNRTAPAFLDWVQRKLAPWRRLDRPAGRRIFLARGPGVVRQIVNEPEVAERLARAGFEIVRGHELGIVEQIALFAGAEAIVGPIGSGFGALLFARAGCTVVELTHGRIAHPYWGMVSALLGFRHTQIVGPSVGNRGPLTFDDDFVVPMAELEAALAGLPAR